jgi:hypothetical protein
MLIFFIRVYRSINYKAGANQFPKSFFVNPERDEDKNIPVSLVLPTRTEIHKRKKKVRDNKIVSKITQSFAIHWQKYTPIASASSGSRSIQ